LAGWDQTLTTLMVERGNALKRYGFLLSGEDATAEDLVQDALVRALGRPFTGRDLVETEAYVRQIMVNLSIDRHRRLDRWRRSVRLLAARDDLPDPLADLAARQDLDTALGRLSPRQRACVVLRYYDDLPIAQVAAVLGVGQGTVKRYVNEALTRLGNTLAASEGSTKCPSTQS
jgi:RNA polymerase sigma factor (sigma-70 family)